MGDRIGFDAAVVFTSTQAEHLATRERVGLYDVYYQGPIDIKGPDAQALLDHVLARDVSASTGRRRPGPLFVGVQRGGRHDRRPHGLSSGTGALLADRHAVARRDRSNAT